VTLGRWLASLLGFCELVNEAGGASANASELSGTTDIISGRRETFQRAAMLVSVQTAGLSDLEISASAQAR